MGIWTDATFPEGKLEMYINSLNLYILFNQQLVTSDLSSRDSQLVKTHH